MPKVVRTDCDHGMTRSAVGTSLRGLRAAGLSCPRDDDAAFGVKPFANGDAHPGTGVRSSLAGGAATSCAKSKRLARHGGETRVPLGTRLSC
jgi:hypothetical protein